MVQPFPVQPDWHSLQVGPVAWPEHLHVNGPEHVPPFAQAGLHTGVLHMLE